jgi:DNA-binding NarL/FixJ family response regulator
MPGQRRYDAGSPFAPAVGGAESTRVVLVEDHPLFAESMVIALRLQGYDATRVPVRAGMVAEVLRREPDLVLLDLNLAEHGSGLDLIEPLDRAGVQVAVVTSETDRGRWGECLDRGAGAVVPKHASLNGIAELIQRAAAGAPLMPEAEQQQLRAAWRERQRAERDVRRRLDRLSRREAEVLGMLMTGRTVSQIAVECYVSVATVRTQVKSVLAKLQVSSQLAAVGLANEVGWTPPTSGRGPNGVRPRATRSRVGRRPPPAAAT